MKPNLPSHEDVSEAQAKVRQWDDHRVSQFGFTNNVVLGLASATLAFIANLAFAAQPPAQPVKALLFAGTILATCSVVLGVALAFNRLYDFRWTSRHRRLWVEILKLKQAQVATAHAEAQLADLRTYATRLGTCSWVLLWTQATLWVGAGIAVGVATLAKLA